MAKNKTVDPFEQLAKDQLEWGKIRESKKPIDRLCVKLTDSLNFNLCNATHQLAYFKSLKYLVGEAVLDIIEEGKYDG